MPKYLLDTNVCGFLLRNKFGVANKLKSVGFQQCAISELTAIELLVGVEYTLQKTGVNQHDRLQAFLQAVTVYPTSIASALAAKEKARLQLAGTPCPDLVDALIACTSIEKRLVMVTENTKHFQGFNGIVLENWVDRMQTS